MNELQVLVSVLTGPREQRTRYHMHRQGSRLELSSMKERLKLVDGGKLLISSELHQGSVYSPGPRYCVRLHDMKDP